MYFKLLDDFIYFINVHHLSKEKRMYYLMEMLFYKEPIFFHYHTDMENRETSILINRDAINPEFLSFFDRKDIEIYRCLQVTNTMDFLNESGLVQRMSFIFSQQNVPILYITTMKSNFILFENKFLEQVEKITNEYNL